MRPFCVVRRTALEEAIGCVADDALVEATPRTIRPRKTPELPQAADE